MQPDRPGFERIPGPPAPPEEAKMAILKTFPLRRPGAPAAEPRLVDLIDDPVAQAVMRRDGVTRESLLAMFDGLKARLAVPQCCGA